MMSVSANNDAIGSALAANPDAAPELTPQLTPALRAGQASAAGASLVVMGVAGCGKSLIAERLALALGAQALEGDSFHPPENIARMSAGVALTDADRAGWLARLAERLAAGREAGQRLVLSCSALKRRYRDQLRAGDPDLVFVCLHGARALIESRMAARTHHFMPVSLLDSQLRDLELPQSDERAVLCNLAATPEQLVAQILSALHGDRA